TAAEALRLVCALVSPVLPHSAQAIWQQLGFTEPVSKASVEELAWGRLKPGQKIGAIAPVFPRLDLKPTVEKMQDLEAKEKERQAALMGKPAEVPAAAVPSQISPNISIDDFSKVDLRVGEVKHAEPVKGADKLLHLKVDIGEAEPRTIVAGIALAYKPEALIGRKVMIVANLQPRKLRGLTSQGMIVAASLEGGLPVLAGFHEDVPVGARLK
ncbi:MAG: methionyl-tRNA synthetase, partial [Bryobacterales bacterium]|nr:methionyl-tRNA synthetase [Bryobacterales bacterium]